MPKRRANGEGSIFVKKTDANGKPISWAAQYTNNMGKVRTLYGKTQQIVKDRLKEAIRLSDTGVTLEPRRISFSDWTKEWLDVYHKPLVRGSTYINACVRWENHIAPYWRKVQLKDVRQETLQKYFNEKAEKYSPSTCAMFRDTIKGALEKAVELGYIPNNPANKVKIPARNYAEKRIFSVEEQKRYEQIVIKDLEYNYNSTIFLLMLCTGLRSGEALGMQIDDIDFENRELTVNRTVGVIPKTGGGVRFYVNTPKTKAGRRTIPLSSKVAALLQMQIDKRNELVNHLRERWEERGQTTEYADAGYLYLTIQGNIINRANLDNKQDVLLSRSDISPRVTLHGLRHTFATRWLEAGLDVRSLAEILGHTDVKMTLNIYTHALPEQKRKNIDAMDRLFE